MWTAAGSQVATAQSMKTAPRMRCAQTELAGTLVKGTSVGQIHSAALLITNLFALASLDLSQLKPTLVDKSAGASAWSVLMIPDVVVMSASTANAKVGKS
jgi:hypothetical protein